MFVAHKLHCTAEQILSSKSNHLVCPYMYIKTAFESEIYEYTRKGRQFLFGILLSSRVRDPQEVRIFTIVNGVPVYSLYSSLIHLPDETEIRLFKVTENHKLFIHLFSKRRI